MNWIMGEPPVAASGTGARKFRAVGTCCDTFSIHVRVRATWASRSVPASSTASARGPKGSATGCSEPRACSRPSYGGQVLVRGKQFYNGGKNEDIYERGAVTNIATFHDQVTNGETSNTTVPESVRSNLVTILGRNAAYQGKRHPRGTNLLQERRADDAGREGLEGLTAQEGRRVRCRARPLGRRSPLCEHPQARATRARLRGGARVRHRGIRPLRPRPGRGGREGARGRRRGGGGRSGRLLTIQRRQGPRVQVVIVADAGRDTAGRAGRTRSSRSPTAASASAWCTRRAATGSRSSASRKSETPNVTRSALNVFASTTSR